MSSRWRLWGLPLLIVVALLVPVLILGLAFEDQVQAWVAAEWPKQTLFWIIVAALSGDIFLPVPSSGVSTYAGGTLGLFSGTFSSWLGMTVGAIGGFVLARLLGRPFAKRIGGEDVRRLEAFSEDYGVATLLLTRPLPLLAEACVLLVGAARLPWLRFLPAIVASNLVISLVYAAAGAYFQNQQVLPQAIIMAVLLPLGATLVVRRLHRRSSAGKPSQP